MRKSIMKFDDMGVDPISSDRLDAILAIEDYETYTVKAETALNPWLIAHEKYYTVELFFVILYYNGLIYPTELTEGLDIKIPIVTQVRKALNKGRKRTEARVAII